jgi:hypothetical protein
VADEQLLGGRVVGVCVSPRRRVPVLRSLRRVARAGGEALLLTADDCHGPGLEEAVRIDLTSREVRLGIHRLLRQPPIRLATRVRPGAGSRSGPSLAWRWWSTSKPYRALRPWLLWRATRHELDRLRPQEIDHALIVGIESWPIVWHLARLNPKLTYGFQLPEGYIERLAAQNGVPVPPVTQPPNEAADLPEQFSNLQVSPR